MTTDNTHRIALDVLDHEVWPAGSDHAVLNPVVYLVFVGIIIT